MKNINLFKKSFKFKNKFWKTTALQTMMYLSMAIIVLILSKILEKVTKPLVDYLASNPNPTSIPSTLSSSISTSLIVLFLGVIVAIFIGVFFQKMIYETIGEKKTKFWKFFLEIFMLTLILSLVMVIFTIPASLIIKKLQSISLYYIILSLIILVALAIDYLYQNILLVFIRTNDIKESFKTLKPIFKKLKHFYMPLVFSVIIFALINLILMPFGNTVLVIVIFVIISILFDVWRKIYFFNNLKENKKILKKDKISF